MDVQEIGGAVIFTVLMLFSFGMPAIVVIRRKRRNTPARSERFALGGAAQHLVHTALAFQRLGNRYVPIPEQIMEQTGEERFAKLVRLVNRYGRDKGILVRPVKTFDGERDRYTLFLLDPESDAEPVSEPA